MSKKKNSPTGGGVESVDQALTKAERFFEENQKSISIVAAIILGIVAIVFGFRKFYLAPNEEEAQSQMFYAERYFELDSFDLALYGDGNNLGFVDIIDNYKLTKSANLSKYYAGICNLNMGNFEDAIEYLDSYRLKDKILATVALGAMGDAYVELDDLEAAIDYYKKAISVDPNEFTTPIYLMKAALTFEALNKYEKALENYQTIKKEFPATEQGKGIDKYIARAEAVLERL
jgi:tetratricopeptide (TPR) repeat protein